MVKPHFLSIIDPGITKNQNPIGVLKTGFIYLFIYFSLAERVGIKRKDKLKKKFLC